MHPIILTQSGMRFPALTSDVRAHLVAPSRARLFPDIPPTFALLYRPFGRLSACAGILKSIDMSCKSDAGLARMIQKGAVMERILGVNLSGWFIPEPWVTPSLYAATGASNAAELQEAMAWTGKVLSCLLRYRL